MTIRFDDSLPALVKVLQEHLSPTHISQGVAVRDITGRLAFVLPDKVAQNVFETLELQMLNVLGPYARKDRVLVANTDYGAPQLLSAESTVRQVVLDVPVRLVDRRLVGADWLRPPVGRAPPPPRFVFSSLKGGVGRSTALSVAASHLAAKGRRVLAVDLDMEAPGLGSLLLDYATLPPYGLIDALVENGLGGLDSEFLVDLVGPSELADRHGRVDVLPAFGRRSLDNSADVLAKLARAYAEDVSPDGGVITLMDQVREIIEQLSKSSRYDAILIDSRAGLHETTATAILGLGAEVLLFGLDEAQTFQGYSALLSHLARFLPGDDGSVPEWLERISVVQGKAPLDLNSRTSFGDKWRQLFVDCGLERRRKGAQAEPQPPAGPFKDVPWDDELPDEQVLPPVAEAFRDPVVILNDDLFRNFDPKSKRDLLTERVYQASFGDFLRLFDDAVASSKELHV